MGQTIKSSVYSVSRLNSEIRKNLESGFLDIWLEGEVSNYYFHNQKHMYFDLKDEYSRIRVVMFQQNNKNLLFNIEDGLHILVNGYISAYEKRGEYQVLALEARPVGKGSLILAFEQLKKKLEKKHYFDKSNKKKIPILPKKIGIATSIGGAVLRDVVSVLRRRFENFNLIVRNVNVSGITSSSDICEALDDLSEFGVDIIILARGGGSLEDLWAFNTEELADKIFSCPIPIVSAIGHETDFTISDFVADMRAATPSVAGEIVILSREEAVFNLREKNKSISRSISSKIGLGRKNLHYLTERRFFKKPEMLINRFIMRMDDNRIQFYKHAGKALRDKRNNLSAQYKYLKRTDLIKKIDIHKMIIENLNMKLKSNIKNILSGKRSNMRLLLKSLTSMDPASILNRGFAIVYEDKEGKVVKGLKGLEIGQIIRILLSDGVLNAKIIDKVYKKIEPGPKNEN